jgi:hypothetical protein
MAIRVAWGLSTLLGLASPALAQDCRLALVLALDVSSSVDAVEDRLQRDGLAQALRAPEVVRAFLIDAPVALYVFEWSDAFTQVPLLPGWQMIESEDDLTRVADVIAGSIRRGAARSYVRTATGDALLHAALALAKAPHCRAQTVDIASDGESNDGLELEVAHAAFSDHVTINALVVARHGRDEGSGASRHQHRAYGQLMGWFEREILRGHDSFCISAEGYEDYERAMTAKLLRELELPMMSGTPVAGGGA